MSATRISLRVAALLAAGLLMGTLQAAPGSNSNWWDKHGDEGPVVENSAPLIGGSPPTATEVGVAYSFLPTASDAEGDRLRFAITNRPVWAVFDRKTGGLSGTPSASDIGTQRSILIEVTDGTNTAGLPPFDLTVTATAEEPPVGNTAPVITGTPPISVRTGSSYSFLPTGTDADGDALSFSIVNRPQWALFDAATGALTGTPADTDVGTTSGIVVRVSDGTETAELAPFDLTVRSRAEATLSWVAPSTREDGTALSLSEIAGYRVYHGLAATDLAVMVDLADPTLTEHTLTDLAAGDHYFALTVYDTGNLESARSAVISKSIQ